MDWRWSAHAHVAHYSRRVDELTFAASGKHRSCYSAVSADPPDREGARS
jgi:hypothetical protein